MEVSMSLPGTLSKKQTQHKDCCLRQIVFLDKIWVSLHGTIFYSWQDDDARSVKTSKADGIIIHVDTANGFVEEADLTYLSTSRNTDCHGKLNKANFVLLFENQLLRN